MSRRDGLRTKSHMEDQKELEMRGSGGSTPRGGSIAFAQVRGPFLNRKVSSVSAMSVFLGGSWCEFIRA